MRKKAGDDDREGGGGRKDGTGSRGEVRVLGGRGLRFVLEGVLSGFRCARGEGGIVLLSLETTTRPRRRPPWVAKAKTL